jgi:PAS domain S-box-containing protein
MALKASRLAVLIKENKPQSPSRFKALLENAYDGIVLYNVHGIIQYASPSVKKIGGFLPIDLIGKSGTSFIHPKEREKARQAFFSLLTHPGKSISLTQRFITKKGDYIWCEYTLTNLLHNPDVRGIASNFRNIHERTLALAKAAETQRLLNILSENITDGIFIGTPQKEFNYVNRAFLKISGYKSLIDLNTIKPQQLFATQKIWENIRERTSPGSIKNAEVLFTRKNGTLFWGLLSLSVFKNNDGASFFVGSVRDITKQKESDEKLRHSEDLLGAISRNVREGFFRSSFKKMIYVNDTFVKMFGYAKVDEILSISPNSIWANVKARKKLFAVLRKEGYVSNYEILYRRKNGETFWGLMSCTLVKNPKGERYLDGSVRDITRQKQAEVNLYRTQNLLTSINHNISEGLYRSRAGKHFIYANPAFLKMFGFKSVEDLNTTTASLLYANRSQEKLVRVQLLEKGQVRNLQVQLKKRSGQLFWGSISCKRVEEDGKEYIDGAIRDITREKEAELQLIDSRNFLDNVMKVVAAPIFVKDSRHRWVMFNDAFSLFMNRKRDELLLKSEKDFLPTREYKEAWRVDNRVLRTGEVVLNREVLTPKKGDARSLLTVKSRYVNDRGEKFVIGFITDLTEIQKVENRIVQLNANLRAIMESTQESIYALDRNYSYIAFNNNHARMARLLYGTQITVGDNKLSYIKGSVEEKWVRSELKKAMRGKNFVSVHCINHAKYKDRWIQTTYNPILTRQHKLAGVAVFVRDITDITRAQRALNQSNATLRGVLESTRDRIIALDRDFNYLLFNQAHAKVMKRLTGVEIKPGDNFLKILPLDLTHLARPHLNKALKGKPTMIEFALADTVLEASINPILDTHQVLIGVTLFIRDITQRKKGEEHLKTLNETLTQQNWKLAAQEEKLKTTLKELSERNFELDQIMYKTSHDLRSPLSSILGLVNLAYIDTKPGNQQEYLEKIEGRIKKLDEFIKSMLNYARVSREDLNYQPVDLGELARSAVEELEYLDNFSAVEVSIKDKSVKPCTFTGDPIRTGIILSNVISNAFKYYNPAVKSYIHVSYQVDPLRATITIKDNGIGIRKEFTGKIFNMFYRATELSQGSGLGMYIVKQGVERMNGSIRVNSVYGKGTSIRITLPNHLT